jgi:hypothetical protein
MICARYSEHPTRRVSSGSCRSFGNIIGLQFAEKTDYVPLQAADILAYEGNKRLRDPSRPERRAWTALDPDKTRIFAAYYGRDNMAGLIDRLEKIRDGRFSEIDLGVGWKRAAQSAGGGRPLEKLLA